MLKGEKVSLNPLKKSDIDLFLKWLNDPEITQYLNRYLPLTREMEEDWFNNLPKRANFVIFSISMRNDHDLDQTIGDYGV